MNLHFTKMHGCGNDYIYFNCFSQSIDSPENLAIKLSDRHFGIGGDGIILVCPSEIADAKMRMFNSDGSEGKMCGNGIRCVGKFLYDNDLIDLNKDEIKIETLSGIKKLQVFKENNEVKLLTVDMGSPILTPNLIPVKTNLNIKKFINMPIKINAITYNINCVSMGNPHCVVFLEDIKNIKIDKIGPLFENNEMFPEGVNTEFVEIIDRKNLKMRVWERGSGETLACGTGACATAVAAVENGFCDKNDEIKIDLKGGELTIKYTDETVYMTGSAEKVFEGDIII